MLSPFNGVLFGEKHSYKDWGLYLSLRPDISPPKPKTVYINIPEADGQIDLSESLTGDIAYDNRTITFTFLVVGGREEWFEKYSEIMDYLHGRKMKVVLDEDPVYYYEGRLEVSKWDSDQLASKIVIIGNVQPYKMESISSLDDWLWDTFNFETDSARDWKGLEVDGSLVVTLAGSRKPVVPTFIVENAEDTTMTLVWEDNVYYLPDGETRIPNVTIREGKQIAVFEGSGTVTVSYRGGRL